MFELGDCGQKEHELIGDYVSSLQNLDLLLTYGPMSELTSKQAKMSGTKNSIHYGDKVKLAGYLKSIIQKGDYILIKGSRGMAMEEVTNILTES